MCMFLITVYSRSVRYSTIQFMQHCIYCMYMYVYVYVHTCLSSSLGTLNARLLSRYLDSEADDSMLDCVEVLCLSKTHYPHCLS